MHLLHQPVRAVVHKEGAASAERTTPTETGARLDFIRRRGVLTVGYLPDSLPYAFFNAAGDLVGGDGASAQSLAAELNHKREVGPPDPDRAGQKVKPGGFENQKYGVAVSTRATSPLRLWLT